MIDTDDLKRLNNLPDWRIAQINAELTDLDRAGRLIKRLRAENLTLKEDHKLIASTIENTKRHISIAGNSHKKFGVALVLSELRKRGLI